MIWKTNTHREVLLPDTSVTARKDDANLRLWRIWTPLLTRIAVCGMRDEPQP